MSVHTIEKTMNSLAHVVGNGNIIYSLMDPTTFSFEARKKFTKIF